MTDPLSSAEIAEAKALCERAHSFENGNLVSADLLDRALATAIEAKNAELVQAQRRNEQHVVAYDEVARDRATFAQGLAAAVKERDELGGSESNWREYAEKLERDLESERAARQEAERMLAEADCCIAVDWTERKFDELSRFENEATYRHRARQAKGES